MSRKFLTGADMNSQRITAVADPSSASDAATKQYVDNMGYGLAWKSPVRATTTTNGTLATAYANGQTIDGITLATGDRILLKNQTTGSENGIYTVNASGAPTRAFDADSATELKGATVTVLEGTVNADRVYAQNVDTITLGTTALVFVQIGAGGTTYTAGDGLSESPAGTFNVATGTGLETNADTVRIAAAAAGAGLTGGAGSALAVGAGTGITVNADDVAINTSLVVRKAAFDTLGTGGAAQAFTHTLNTLDVQVQVVEVSTGATVEADIVRTSTTVVTVTFPSQPTAAQYRVLIQG